MRVASIELSLAQQRHVVWEYLKDADTKDVLDLFLYAMEQNFHTIDHVALVRTFARRVEIQCNLPRGYVLKPGGK